MKTIKALLFILSFTLAGTILDAQFDMPKYDRVIDLKDRQPIVIVNPPNPDIISKYNRKSKPEVVQTYEQVIGNYNEALKIAAKNFWNFNSKEILFKTRAEIQDMMKDKNERDKYFIIYCYSLEGGYKRDLDWNIDNKATKITGTYTHFAIGLPDEMPFYQVLLHDLLPTPTMLGYFMANANYKFNYVLKHKDNSDMRDMVDKNAHILAQKTLLITGTDVSPKVINDIHTLYPCNVRLVADSEMQSAVLSGDTAYAYVIHSNGSTGKAGGSIGSSDMNWIVNCTDGAPLGYSKKGTEIDQFTDGQNLRKDFFLDIADFCGAGRKK